jgi:membrane fusion protein, multidrug efflux system
MKKRTLFVGVVALLALAGAAVFVWNGSPSQRASAQAQRPGQRQVPVAVAIAEKRSVPIRLEALGTVTTMANVAVKTRIDSEIVEVKFADGQRVKQGDVLFVLDSRSIEAEMKRVQAVIAGAEAQFEQATRDVQRYAELVSKNATTVVTLNNAQTQVNVSRALADSNKATLEGLKVQLGYCTIVAPISGRISMAMVKVGNVVRQADVAPLATINQISPIYVSFTVPQRSLPDVRAALSAETASIEAIVPGSGARASGQVTMIENAVDAATGMVTIRATMPNAEEILWPGTLVNTQLMLRTEKRVAVPATALQVSQAGSFVFVVKDDVATVRPVKVERTVDGQSAIESGLEEGEAVVTDGQLLLSNGTRVTRRSAGS